jgi:hypothetical protein
MRLATGGAGRLPPMHHRLGTAPGNRTGDGTGHKIGATTGWMLGSTGPRLCTLGFFRMRA